MFPNEKLPLLGLENRRLRGVCSVSSLPPCTRGSLSLTCGGVSGAGSSTRSSSARGDGSSGVGTSSATSAGLLGSSEADGSGACDLVLLSLGGTERVLLPGLRPGGGGDGGVGSSGSSTPSSSEAR